MMPWRAIGLFVVFVGFCGLPYAQTANTVYHADGSQASPPTSVDSNADGWPDNPFAALGDGDLWVSTGSPRTVAALRWSVSGGAGFQPVVQTIDLDVPRPGSPDQRIVIEAPGSLAETGEVAVLLIGVAPDLESLLGNEAAGIAAHDGASVLSGGQYIEISVLISGDGGATFDELDPARLQDAPIRLRMENLTASADAIPVLYEHPTYVAANAQSGIQLQAETGAWTPASCITLPHAERALEDTVYPAYIEAELRSLSVFALLDGTTDSTNTLTGGETENENTGTTGGTEIDELTLDGETLTGGTTLLEAGEGLLDDPNGGGQMSMLLGPGDPVWVDFGSGGAEDGTQQNPFNRFIEGLFTAAVNGSDTILIDRQTPIYRSGESGTYSLPNPVTIEAVNGPVRIGEATATLFTYFTGIGAVVYEPVGESLSELSYAINPESRTFPEGAAITVKAYAAEGYKFDGWWFPEDPAQPASPEDLLPAAIHSFTLERDRLLWPVFTLNDTNLDTADPDEDGLANFRETELGTNPNSADSDGDGLPDWWEVNYSLDPLSTLGPDGTNGNPDSDEWVNAIEFSTSLNPRDVQAVQDEMTVTVFGRVFYLNNGALLQTEPTITHVTPPLELDGLNFIRITKYLRGTDVIWQKHPLQPFQDYVVDGWWATHSMGGSVYLGDEIEVNFTADPAHYFSGLPPIYQAAMTVQVVIRPISDPGTEFTGIDVTAPGPYGNMSFHSDYTEWGTPEGTPQEREQEANDHPNRQPYPRASEVYFNAIREQTPEGDFPGPFEVKLEAKINTTLSEENINVAWSFYGDSVIAGRLVADGRNARLEFDDDSPPVPGLYKIKCEVQINGEASAPPERTAVAYVLLPFAGPDVQDWIIHEARQLVIGVAPFASVGQQWVNHVIEEGNIIIIHIPGIGDIPFDPTARLYRAFAGVAAYLFDYYDIVYLSGSRSNPGTALRPTKKYAYTDLENDSAHPPNFRYWDDPASGTIDDIVISKGRINSLLLAIWAKSVFDGAQARGYHPFESELQEDLAIVAGGAINGFLRGQRDDPTAAWAGIHLYYAIMDGKDDAWIKTNVLTVNLARGMQTKNDPDIWDEELWPRSDYVAPKNDQLIWRSSTATLDDFKTFIRPDIFVTFDEMDILP